MSKDTLKIWPDESSSYNAASLTSGYPAYLSLAERVRLEKIRQARAVFDGAHRKFFLDDSRTQYFYRKVRGNSGAITPLYTTCNLLRLVCMKSADLLLGEIPLITSDNDEQQYELEALADRCGLHQVLYQGALDASQETDCYLEATIYDEETYVQQIPGDEIWPVGPVMPDGQHREYLRRVIDHVKVDGKERPVLLETRYRAGSIERRLYVVTEEGTKGRELDVSAWPGYTKAWGTGPRAIQATGIEWNTVTWIPNLLVRRKPVSEFDGGVLGLQDTVNAKNSQLAYVILRHTQPKLIVPEQLLDEGNLPDLEVFTAQQGDPEAKYLTWDAQLDAAQKDRSFHVNQLLVQTETSPVLLGMKEGAAPDAYRKVRLEAFNSVTKAARKAVYWREGIRTAITSALMLNGTLPGKRFDWSEISVQLRDGIPADTLDEANRLATLKTADIFDDEQCLDELIGDPDKVQEILARKSAKAAAATPSILVTPEPGMEEEPQAKADDPEPAAPIGGEQQSDAVATNDLKATVGGSQAIRELQKMYYAGELPREACIANAKIVFGFESAEAEELFPAIAPDAPGDESSKSSGLMAEKESS